MTNNQRQVIDNTALAPLTRKLFDGTNVPNEIRWTHEERESTLEGKHGHGKIRRGNPTWASATSKPFGSVFKPIRPEVGKIPQACRKVENLSAIVPIIPYVMKSEPQVLICTVETPNTLAESRLRGARLALEMTAKATDVYASKVVKRAKANVKATPRLIGYEELDKGFKANKIGLDKVASPVKAKLSNEEKERIERNDLMLYWLTLRSIYRLIYG